MMASGSSPCLTPLPRPLTSLIGRELDVESARTQLIAKLSAETTIGEGEQIELAFYPRELHLFDPATGTTLTQEPLRQAA